MSKSLRLAAALATVLLSTIAGAQPPDFAARYSVSRAGLTLGEAEVRYERLSGGRYRYQSHTQPTGLAALLYRSEVRESSEGLITADGYRPQRYEYDRSGKGERYALLTFDWQRRQVVNDVGAHPWRMAIPSDAMDRLVTPLQLMHDLAEDKQELVYRIADGGKLKTYRLRVTGTEEVETPVGRFQTVRVVRQRDDDRRTTLWCAPALNYLAVKVEQWEEDDGTYTMTLEQLSGVAAGTERELPEAPNPAMPLLSQRP